MHCVKCCSGNLYNGVSKLMMPNMRRSMSAAPLPPELAGWLRDLNALSQRGQEKQATSASQPPEEPGAARARAQAERSARAGERRTLKRARLEDELNVQCEAIQREHAGRQLCALSDIADGHARSFALDVHISAGDVTREVDVIVARRGEGVFGYLNSCPHVGTSLNMEKDDFMSIEPSGSGSVAHLRCSTHFALFDVSDGLCIAGPCTGQSLVSVPLAVGDSQQICINPAPILPTAGTTMT